MRSAVPAPPGAAVALFGAATETAVRFASLLGTHGVERGLIGPREVPRLWERHLLNCGVLAELVPGDAEVVDIGSGAGLPGLVIAMLRPQVRMTLLEPMLRRTTFLGECVTELGLGNVMVCRGRAEDMGNRDREAGTLPQIESYSARMWRRTQSPGSGHRRPRAC